MKFDLQEKDGRLAATYELEPSDVNGDFLKATELTYMFEDGGTGKAMSFLEEKSGNTTESNEFEKLKKKRKSPDQYYVKLAEWEKIKPAYERKAVPPIQNKEELFKRIKSEAYDQLFDSKWELSEEKIPRLEEAYEKEEYKSNRYFLWGAGALCGLFVGGLIGATIGAGAGELLARKYFIPKARKKLEKGIKKAKEKAREYEKMKLALHRLELAD